ncbi:MAG: hypothetical protein WCY38_05075 [Endomicrobiia bacterium]
MKKLLTIVFGFLIFLSLGCASTTANLQRETARSIGGNIFPEQITITNVNRGVTEVKWDAETPEGKYKCYADDMLRRVNCIKIKP